MAIAVTVVGGPDRALEERLRSAGMRAARLSPAELSSLASPAAIPPDVVVVDLRAQREIPPVLAVIKRQHPETGLIIVTSQLDPAMMLEAMRAGVTECVTDVDRGDLEAAINRLIAQRAARVQGDTFVFLGAKGGVGTTTIAVNVGAVLADVHPTLVIDLHLTGGDAALYFAAESQFSVLDAVENTDRLDASFFRGLVVRTKAGPDLLPSSERAAVMPVDPPRIRALIDFASHHYRYTVIDIPRADVAVLDSLEQATRIVVVANQELATIRSAGRVAAMLRQRYGKDKVTVVISRADKHAEISLEDMRNAVGSDVKHVFPSDYRLAIRALNRGEPLVSDIRTPLAQALRGYARELAGVDEAERSAPAKSGGLFGRLTGRR